MSEHIIKIISNLHSDICTLNDSPALKSHNNIAQATCIYHSTKSVTYKS